MCSYAGAWERSKQKMTPKPIQSCYWVVYQKLLAGEYPRNKEMASSRLKINALMEAGVSAFIDLTEANEGLLPYTAMLKNASHQRFPVRDLGTPDSPETTSRILDAIDWHIERERMVYLHCWGGVGRTGLIVGCWLARHGYQGQAALDRLEMLWRQCPKSAYRQSPETQEQKDYIRSWKE